MLFFVHNDPVPIATNCAPNCAGFMQGHRKQFLVGQAIHCFH